MRALDSRLPAANAQRTGGLLQSLTYTVGQSGGGWPVLSFALNDFPTVDEILEIWQPWKNRVQDVPANATYAGTPTSIFEDLYAKFAKGYDVGAMEYFGRAYSYEFFPGVKGAFNVTYSGIKDIAKFESHEMPLPILVTSQLDGAGGQSYFGLETPGLNATNYEITPFEFGSWGGETKGFTPVEYIGTVLKNRAVVNESACVRGYDRVSFIWTAAASAMNKWYIQAASNGTESPWSKKAKRDFPAPAEGVILVPLAELQPIIDEFEEKFNLTLAEMAYTNLPNPFLGLNSSSDSLRAADKLTLVDSSETGLAIPLTPLIQPERNPSFIIAWDDNVDSLPYDWNNGTNIYDAYVAANASGIPFPIIPPVNTIINRNYTLGPVFFGCDADLTTTGDTRAPIILYMANAPYSAYTNYSWVGTSYPREQMEEIFENSFNYMTQGNGTLDEEWPACLGCAAIDRSLEKVGMQRTEQCKSCFERYCWDGTTDEHTPGIIDPALKLDPGLGFEDWKNAGNPF